HVDRLDGLFLAHATLRCDVLEGVEVYADEVERLDAMLGKSLRVFREPSPRQDPRVDARMQRLDAAAEQLRELGQRLDPLDVQPVLSEVRRSPPARDKLPAELRETGGEPVEPCLVVDGDQSPQSALTTLGRSRCSTACTRARRLSTVSSSRTGTRSAAMTGPVSTPSST